MAETDEFGTRGEHPNPAAVGLAADLRSGIAENPVSPTVPDRRALSESMTGVPGSAAGRLRRHLSDPFFRNAYALMLNTGLTGLLGVLFWLLAARHYVDSDVGHGSALISTMTLLSGVVAVNVTGTLARFVPQSGRGTRQLVLCAYVLSSVAVTALTAGFLLTLDYWGPAFDSLRDPEAAFWFVLTVVASGLFTIQDGVLIGLRSAVWVPVENAVFGLAKIILLLLLVGTFPHQGVYLSWVIPMALLLLPINGLIFGRLIPHHVRTTSDTFIPPTRAQLGRFFAADYAGALFMFAAVYLVPVMVAASVAPDTFAHFYVAWMGLGILNLVAINLATSMTVEGCYAMHTLATNCRAALRRAVGIALVAGVVVALAAPYALGLLGHGYLDAAPLLQLLAFATLPRAIQEIWIGVLRAQSRPRQVARVQIGSGALVVGSVLLWLQVDPKALDLGLTRITGVGLAVLASQTLVALAVLPQLVRFLTGTREVPARTPAVAEPVEPARVQHHLEPHAEPGLSPTQPDRRVLRRLWSRLPLAAVCLLSAGAVLLFVLPLQHVELDRINGYGLVSVLPVLSLGALALLTVTFVITLAFPRPYPAVLGAQLVALTGCLHGVAALVEPLPRFPITWVHLGFVEFIGRTGTTAPGLDARFSWPGFFALVAFLTGERGWPDLAPWLKLTPLFTNLLLLVPLGLLLRNLRAGWRAKWFAALLFCALNLVGQDYFSPQGFSYLLYLVFLAILITWFRPVVTGSAMGPDPAGNRVQVWWRRRWPPALVPGELPARPADLSMRATLLLLLIGLFTVVTVSHQLTPFVLVAACTGLVLARRCVSTGLPVLLVVILAAWLSYMTVAYWSGHLDEMLSGVGGLGGNLSASVAGRAAASDAQHQIVVYARLALAAGLFALAAIGLMRRRRRNIDDRVALVLVIIPFVALALQSYGGEIALRVYLFALPAACVLAAYAVFPDGRTGRRAPHRFVAAAACAIIVVGGFLLTRYGNEQYEITRPGELAAVQEVYQRPGDARLIYLDETDGGTPFIPVGYQAVERVTHLGVPAPQDPNEIGAVIHTMRDPGPTAYLITTRSQEAYLELTAGYPPGWGDHLRARLAAAAELQLVKDTGDAVVYTLRGSHHQPPVPVQQQTPTGTSVHSTPWTPVGVAFLALLLILLTGTELWRLRLAPADRWRLRPLIFAAVPLVAGLALVILERLIMLAE